MIMNMEDFCKKFEQLSVVYEGIKTLQAQNTALTEQNEDLIVYKNTLESMSDGIKIIADENNPFELTFPMLVNANMFYKYEDKVYVAVKDGTVDSITEEYFELWNTEEVDN